MNLLVLFLREILITDAQIVFPIIIEKLKNIHSKMTNSQLLNNVNFTLTSISRKI